MGATGGMSSLVTPRVERPLGPGDLSSLSMTLFPTMDVNSVDGISATRARPLWRVVSPTAPPLVLHHPKARKKAATTTATSRGGTRGVEFMNS